MGPVQVSLKDGIALDRQHNIFGYSIMENGPVSDLSEIFTNISMIKAQTFWL